eukprot:jgi/Chlat1/8995/Chrsp94S08282
MTDLAQHPDFHFTKEYPMQALLDDCRMLQQLLDDCLRMEVGEDMMGKLEQIRALALSSHDLLATGANEAVNILNDVLEKKLINLPLNEIVPLARAFSHYLNLTSIAETHHQVRRTRAPDSAFKSCDEVFEKLLQDGYSAQDLHDAVSKTCVEIVLTAHPTQVNRRTLQYKHTRIAACLEHHDRPDLTQAERDLVIDELVREITALWQTDELRRRKPTPLDEARGGLHLVEQSLWTAVPTYLRNLSISLLKFTGKPLPVNVSPLRFGSWIGGDRDGNPNVTAKACSYCPSCKRVTSDVSHLARWLAADLYLREIDTLRFELSMSFCNEELGRLSDELLAKDLEHQEDNAQLHRATSSAHDHDDHGVAGMIIGTRPVEMSLDHFVNIPEMPIPGSVDTRADGSSPSFSALPSPHESVPPSPLGRPAHQFPPYEIRPVETKAPTTAVSASSTPTAGGVNTASGMARRKSFTSTVSRNIDALLNPKRSFVTPYRVVLTDVRQKLLNTRRRMEDLLAGNPVADEECYETTEELAQPLLMCYRSLHECGSGAIADGRLLDILRRLYTFGLTLCKLDIRQEKDRHTEALTTLTEYLGLGSYGEWDEDAKIKFLVTELQGRRPLIPSDMPVSENVKEVFDTFKVAAALGSNNLGAYVISMAEAASDVLAVELLQREARIIVAGEQGRPPPGTTLRVVPLFETLKDLRAAGGIIRQLLAVPWYKEHLIRNHGAHQEVMIGYSDSGKDAGRFAAAWELYKVQEDVTCVCAESGIQVTLFHGRGGSVGRGGGPMYLAIQSQPPGSVQGSLRITEQGEMVQAKFGIPAVGLRQLEIYTTAVVRATLHPPSTAKNLAWREMMDRLSDISCKSYRGMVYETPNFGPYFHEATPEAELGNLNIGSRPARRKAAKPGDVRSLRAIPWIFAWTQTRLILPAWLGIGDALSEAIQDGHKSTLQEMYQQWPFFQSTIDLIEMILAKVDLRIAGLYDAVLVSPENKELGELLRNKFKQTVRTVLEVSGHKTLLENNKVLKQLIALRNPFLEPINILQVEILRRLRQEPNNQRLRDALLITINGIAAGMRNTG